MIIGLVGARGTIPTASMATVSFLVDHRILFECPSEIIPAFDRFQKDWMQLQTHPNLPQTLLSLGRPTLGKIKYIVLSHLHYDHWGGLPHIIHRLLLLEREMREQDPLRIIIPENSTLPFQQRMQQLLQYNNKDFPLSDAEFLYHWLTIEVGEAVRKVITVTVIEEDKPLNLDQGYSLIAKKNSHLPQGSVSYKLSFLKRKLNVPKAKAMGIPFNSSLKRIERSENSIEINGKKISRSDIFYDITTALGYSGDTQIDPVLCDFFNDTQIIIHEATYLKPDNSYHLDAHSDLQSLIHLLQEKQLVQLKGLIPVHFSTRYSDEEISTTLESLNPTSFVLIDPMRNLYILVSDTEIIDQIPRPT